MSSEEQEFDFQSVVDFVKKVEAKHLVYLVLLGLMLFGIGLRVYHLDYPVIGYHNWKEVHYLSEARSFAEDGFFAYGFFAPHRDWATLQDDEHGVHGDTFPTISIVVGFLFKLFGQKLWLARLVGVLAVVFSIPFVYFYSRRVFKQELAALFAAALFTFNPVLVFFSRNVQLINISLFAFIVGLWAFEEWIAENKRWQLIVATCGFTLAAATKYSFAIAALYVLFRFPYARLKQHENYKLFGICAGIASLSGIWFLYSNYYLASVYNTKQAITSGTFSLMKLFDPEFVQVFKFHILDNYTQPVFYLALLGLIPAFLYWKRSLPLLAYFVSGVAYLIAAAEKIQGHSYHHYPIVLLVILLATYAVVFIVNTLTQLLRLFVKQRVVLRVFPILLLCLVLFYVYTPSTQAFNRQFDTQFPGLDVAGEYIRTHQEPGDTVISSSHQAYGLLWHGHIFGSKGIPGDVETFKRFEDERGANWLFVYNWDFALITQEPLLSYVSENYRLVQAGFQQGPQGLSPLYLLLRKGGTFNLSQLGQEMSSVPIQQHNYEYTFGGYSIAYGNLE